MKKVKIQQSDILDIQLKIVKYFDKNAISVLDKTNYKTNKEFISLINQNMK